MGSTFAYKATVAKSFFLVYTNQRNCVCRKLRKNKRYFRWKCEHALNMPLTCTFAQNLKMLVFGNMRFVYRTSVLAYLANMQNVLNMHFSCTKWCSACFPTLSTAKCKRFHKQTGLYVYAMFIQCFENKPVLFKMWIIKSQKYPKKPTQVGSNLS